MGCSLWPILKPLTVSDKGIDHDRLSSAIFTGEFGSVTDSHQTLGIGSFSHGDSAAFVNCHINTLPLSLNNDGDSLPSQAVSCLLRKSIFLGASISDEELVSTCIISLSGLWGSPIVSCVNCLVQHHCWRSQEWMSEPSDSLINSVNLCFFDQLSLLVNKDYDNCR